jgi:hypothetical protein
LKDEEPRTEIRVASLDGTLKGLSILETATIFKD